MSEEEKKAIEYLKQNSIVEIKYDNYGLKSIHRVGIEEKQTILNLIEKQQKEIKEKNKLVLHMKERLNNISFEVECMWRKIEKVENRYE